MKIEADERIVNHIGYEIPDTFVCLQGVTPKGRKKWQFWRPRMLYVFSTIEKKPIAATS